MNNAPVIDLSLRTPSEIIADKGVKLGLLQVVWFRLIRPATVGSLWAAIGVYTYRYLMPFNENELPLDQLLSYMAAIGSIAAALVVWMTVSRVAHPFASRSRMQRLLRRTAGLTVEPGPFAAASLKCRGAVARVFIASHDANGLIAALRAMSEPEVEGDDDGPADAPIGAEPGHARWYDTSLHTPHDGPLHMPVNMPIRVRYVMGSRPMTDTEL
ncbi:hypothetical protein [Paraburkholderia solisilvae]|uniref:Biofilm PGA synthesis auxiliary protein PgaD n=1 Tax=Paraburkholderia solisilvae TaxID=624376 RepID=A0A6J5DGH6_9BURK|nr:hypothetical protein [Paraburkholderia solisilvae]CAB3752272.1 hypothetical protein LMG29739_01486 [Paraburkholderia solisilvae]